MAVALDRGRRIAGVVDDDLLGRDERADGRLVGDDIELGVVEIAIELHELHQVDRRQIARRVVQEHVLGTGITGENPVGVRARVPLVDRGVELHAGVAADVGAFGDEPHQVARLVPVHHIARPHRVRLPRAVVEHRAHELVGDADAVVRVLEEDRRVGRTGERTVVAGVDERPRFLLLLDLAADELDDVGVIGVEDHHLGRAPRLAAGLDDARERVVPLHERDGARRRAAARQELTRGPDRRQIRARARSELEEHPLGARQTQNRVHRVLHRVDETGGALRRRLEAAVEPDGTVERGLLIDEDVLQVVAERLEILVARKISVRARPVGDRGHDASDELLDAALALGRSDLAPEILRHHDVGGLLRPELRHLDVTLLEHHFAAFVADDRRALLPLDLVERIDAGLGEEPGECQAGRLRRVLARAAVGWLGTSRAGRRPRDVHTLCSTGFG